MRSRLGALEGTLLSELNLRYCLRQLLLDRPSLQTYLSRETDLCAAFRGFALDCPIHARAHHHQVRPLLLDHLDFGQSCARVVVHANRHKLGALCVAAFLV